MQFIIAIPMQPIISTKIFTLVCLYDPGLFGCSAAPWVLCLTQPLHLECLTQPLHLECYCVMIGMNTNLYQHLIVSSCAPAHQGARLGG